MRCPFAEWVPWKPASAEGRPTYFAGQNEPVAVVLHVMQGYQSTARRWAQGGHFGQSWHYSVGRDGSIMQHLEHHHGGYHAGISAAKARDYRPTWPLWRATGQNVNTYTIGVEHEGFAGQPFPPAQAKASRRLCRWLAEVLDIPLNIERYPAHADIDLRDRPNDFNTPALRDAFYTYLFAEDTMDNERIASLEARIERIERIVAAHGLDAGDQRLRGENALEWLDSRGISLALFIYRLNAALVDHISEHEAGANVQ